MTHQNKTHRCREGNRVPGEEKGGYSVGPCVKAVCQNVLKTPGLGLAAHSSPEIAPALGERHPPPARATAQPRRDAGKHRQGQSAGRGGE